MAFFKVFPNLKLVLNPLHYKFIGLNLALIGLNLALGVFLLALEFIVLNIVICKLKVDVNFDMHVKPALAYISSSMTR